MKAKWNEWKNSIKQMRVDKRWFDITCKIISFPFVLLYHILNFCLTFSKVILNVILLVLIIGGIAGGILYAKILPMYQDSCEQAYDKLSNLNENSFHTAALIYSRLHVRAFPSLQIKEKSLRVEVPLPSRSSKIICCRKSSLSAEN